MELIQNAVIWYETAEDLFALPHKFCSVDSVLKQSADMAAHFLAVLANGLLTEGTVPASFKVNIQRRVLRTGAALRLTSSPVDFSVVLLH